ncbi:MAG: DUF4214 domain-containing protein [Lachnospiraceae bacterium]|nr:DUF4214 domain-containing protein [Lachnospiraceae bacterium]
MKIRSNTYIKKTIYLLVAFFVFAVVSFGFKMNASADTLVEVNAKNFPDYYFRRYVTTSLDIIKQSNGKIFVSQNTLDSVTELNLDGKGGVEYTNLTGLNHFRNLEKLSCVQNPGLNALDVTQNVKLKELHCYNTGIKNLNLRYNTNLEILECQNCKLTSLDITKNTKLKELDCRNNAITALNIINNDQLISLRCHQNRLTTLNTDNNTKLEYLSCYNNNLTSLSLKNNTKLVTLYCGDNAITTINYLGNCSKLEVLECSNNKLTSLDVNNLTKLLSLDCRNNNIDHFSVRNSKDIKELLCNGNNCDYVVINESGVLHNLRATATRQTNEYNKTITYQKDDKIIVTDLATTTQELEATITVVEMDEAAIRALVTRLYFTMLKREPENGAVDTWTNRLLNKEVNGVELGRRFALSEEITKSRPVSDKEFVTRLYKTFLDREGSEKEINGWVETLNNGKTREYVLAGFVNSQEFDKFCKECGITRGTMTVQNPDKPKNNNNNNNTNPNAMRPLKVDTSKVDDAQLTAFVERLYKKALGRTGESAGVSYWKGCILYGKDVQGREYDIRTVVSKGFFLSQEYANKKTSNAQFVADCYAAFFDRDPRGTEDEVNYKNWVKQLDEGKLTRQQMIEHGFGDSQEFRNLIKSYGFIILN